MLAMIIIVVGALRPLPFPFFSHDPTSLIGWGPLRDFSWHWPRDTRDALNGRAAHLRVAPADLTRGGSLGLALFVVISARTVLSQAPQPQALSGGFDRDAYNFLLNANWIRTAAW